jgi:hypothetical protein
LIWPVPNAIERVLLLFELKKAAVNVLLLSVIAPAVNVVVPANVTLPDNEMLMSDLLMTQVVQAAVDATVTVAAVPLLLSKLTVSPVIGGPKPPGPPVNKAQFVVLELFQVPEPPTQKYVAII